MNKSINTPGITICLKHMSLWTVEIDCSFRQFIIHPTWQRCHPTACLSWQQRISQHTLENVARQNATDGFTTNTTFGRRAESNVHNGKWRKKLVPFYERTVLAVSSEHSRGKDSRAGNGERRREVLEEGTAWESRCYLGRRNTSFFLHWGTNEPLSELYNKICLCNFTTRYVWFLWIAEINISVWIYHRL